MTDSTDINRLEQIAEGLLGEVYVAEVAPDGGRVALKELTHVRCTNPEGFRQHFESLARLDHPNLAVYYDWLEGTEVPSFTAELIDGVDLYDYLRQPVRPEEIEELQARARETAGQDVADEDAPSSTEPSDDAPSSAEARADSETTEAQGDGEGKPEADQDRNRDDDAERREAEAEASSGSGPRPAAGRPEDAGGQDGEKAEPLDAPDEQNLTSEAETTEAEKTETEKTETEKTETEKTDDAEAAEAGFDDLDLVFLRLEHVLPQLLAAMEHLHRFRKPHGNLKPSNILVDPEGRCTLCDFGLVPGLELLEQRGPSEETENAPCGHTPPPEDERAYSLAYWAPERREGEPATPAADLYALGCILFEAITGCRPLGGGDGAIDRFPDRDSLQISELEPRCPAAWVDLILQLVEPDPEKRADLGTVREILERTRARAVDVPPSFVSDEGVFFGRDGMLDALVEKAKDVVRREHLGMTMLRGRPGYGKTALAERLARWAAQRGWLVLRGRCYHRESLIYQGWDEIAQQLAEICENASEELADRLEPHRRGAARLFPVLAQEGDPSDGEDEEYQPGRRATIAAFRRLLRTLSRERPLLLIFDDLNWSSWDTSSLLADVVGEPEAMQVMVLGTWRDDSHDSEHHLLSNALRTSPLSVDWLEVRGFSDREAREYVNSTAGHLPVGTRDRIVEVGGRTPLLLEEMIFQEHLVRTHTFDRSKGEPVTAGDLSGEASTGERLTRLLKSRMEHLSRREEFILQILSVASLPLSEGLISLVLDEEFRGSGPTGNSVRDILRRLTRFRLVQEVRSHHWQRAYTLFHNICRKLILEDVHEQHYAHLCAHIADGLRRLWPEADELRFEYLLRSKRTPEALDSAVRSARTAEERFAYHRASKVWRWIDEHPEITTRLTSLQPRQELAESELRAGRPSEALTIIDGVAAEMPDSLERARLRIRQLEAALRAGRRDRAFEILDDGLEYFGEKYTAADFVARLSEWKNRAIAATNRWSDDLEAASVARLPSEQWLRADFYREIIKYNDLLESRRGTRYRAKLSAMAERSGNANLLAWDRLFLAEACHPRGLAERLERAEEWYREADRLFERLEHRRGRALVALQRARLARTRGELEEADRLLDEAHQRFEASGEEGPDESYRVGCERARLHLTRGQIERSVRRARKVAHLHRGDALAGFRSNQILLPAALLSGETDRAEVLVERCRTFLEGPALSSDEIWLARQITRLNLALGRPEVAVGQLDVLDDQLHRAGLTANIWVRTMWHLSLGQALAALVHRKRKLGEPRADQPMRRIRASAGQLTRQLDHLTPRLRAEVLRFRARVALLLERPEQAVELTRQATEVLAAHPNPVARTLCAEAHGLALRANSPKQGTSLIEQSRVIYEHLGVRFPLVLEGWPIPVHHSALHQEVAE